MSSRIYLAVALAAGTVVALTGCLAPMDPAPTDADSPEANCSPDTATIFWDKVMEGGQTNVGAYVLPGTEAGEGAEPELIDIPLDVEFSGDGLNLLTDFDSSSREVWQSALLQDAQRTGQVDRDFGETAPLPARPASTIEFEAPGTGVQVMSRPQLSMPFEIQCVGMEPVEGTVQSVSNSTLSNTFYLCDDTIELTSPQAEFAQELCLNG
jgi:hypothetical protein